jgi:4-amino-4-deoxychorismate lyase
MSQFIESIKIEDGKIPLLKAHQERLNQTLQSLGSTAVIDLLAILPQVQHQENGLFKWRVVYNAQGLVSQSFLPYFRSATKDFELVEAPEIDYRLKYENRDIFAKLCAESRAQDVIITQNKLICDSSYANLIFKKGKQWYCPNTFLLNGVQRQTLLAKKSIKSMAIGLHNLREFSHFQIINALNGLDEGFEYPIQKIINLPPAL